MSYGIAHYVIFLSGEQFRRCLDQHLGLRITEADYAYLCEKYGTQQTGRVNYRAFAGALENGESKNVCALLKVPPRCLLDTNFCV